MSAVSAALESYCFQNDPQSHYTTVFDGNQETQLPQGAYLCDKPPVATVQQPTVAVPHNHLPQVGSSCDILIAFTIALLVSAWQLRRTEREAN